MAEEAEVPQTITIHNKISPNYKSFHADGAFGGFTPRGLISLSFFSERFPIPKSNEFALANGKINGPVSTSQDSKSGIIREYEVGLYLDISVAKELIELLSSKVTELESLTNQQHSE